MDHFPFKPGYAEDLPVRPGNLLQLDWEASTRNMINIWLPEALSCAEQGLLLMILREEVDFRFEQTPEGHWRHSFAKPGLNLEATLRPIAEGVEMELSITNAGPRDWVKVRAGICVQFHAAPDFLDPELERTFYLAGGKLRTPGAPMSAWAPADTGFVGIHSRDARHTVALWWEDAKGVGGNQHPATACLHADPAFGNIPAGSTITRKGCIYLMPGDPADALERFKKDSGFHPE